MVFIPRTTAPSTTDKNWIKTTYGGYNHAMKIGSNGSVIPNCTGYVHGRWLELGLPESKLCVNNAEIYWDYTRDGFGRGQTPKLGAIVCWRKGAAGPSSDGAGHVAIVEEIYSDGTILVSQSNHGGTRFYTKRINPKIWPGGAYTFQGYIYSPIDFGGNFIEPVNRNKSIPQLQINYEYLNARSSPSLADNIYGYIPIGFYNVLSLKDMRQEASNGYLWYQIENKVWVADIGGDDVKYLAPSEAPKDYTKRLKIGFASPGDIRQIEALLDSMDIGYVENPTGFIITDVAPSKGDRTRLEAYCDAAMVEYIEYTEPTDKPTSPDDNTQKEIAALKEEIATLNTEIAALNTKATSLSAEVVSLKEQNVTLSNKNDEYSSAIESIKSIISNL